MLNPSEHRNGVRGGQELLSFPVLEQILPFVLQEAPVEGNRHKKLQQAESNRAEDKARGFQLLQEERRK